MATTEVNDSVSTTTELKEGIEPVLALLAEISGSLKDLNTAFKNHSERILKLESDRSGDNWRRRRLPSLSREEVNTRRLRVTTARSGNFERRDAFSHRDETSSYESYTDSDDAKEAGVEEAHLRAVNRRKAWREQRERRQSRKAGPRSQVITVEKTNTPSPQRRTRSTSPSVREVIVVDYDGSKLKSQDGRAFQGSDDEEEDIKDRANTANSWRHPLEKYTTELVKYGEWPQNDLCQQLFGDLPSKKKKKTSAWLQEKRLIFPRDERCSFTFDSVALAQKHVSKLDGFLKTDSIRQQIEDIRDFARELRSRGGFFFFRESYMCDDGDDNDKDEDEDKDNKLKGENKIYNGTDVFRCEDGAIEALPILSEDRKDFCEELANEELANEEPLNEVDSSWGSCEGDESLRKVFKKRKEMTEEIEFLYEVIHDGDLSGNSDDHSGGGSRLKIERRSAETGPEIAYLYKGAPYTGYAKISNTYPRAVKVYGNGWESPVRSVCLKFRDPHIMSPWRRLW